MTVARRLLTGLGAALAAGYLAFGASTCRARVTPAPTAPDELRGVWHVHTTRSDGRGTLADVVRAAREAGAAFVVIADHNVLTPREQGWRDGVLVVEATELSTRLGHVVALGLDRPLSVEERADDPLGTVAARGGHAVVAHPLHPRRPFRGLGQDLPWTGFEVFSNDSAWYQALAGWAWDRILLAALELPWDGGRAVLDLAGSPDPELARFDAERRAGGGAGRRVLLCSADAHGYPGYRPAFEAVTMHVPVRPTGDGARDARAVAAALLDGSATCVLSARGSVSRLRFQGGPDPALEVELPAPAADATLRLVRDGAVVADRSLPLHAGRTRVPLRPLCAGSCAPGEYRLELRRAGAPWIFTNPAAIE